MPVSTPCGHNFCRPCIHKYWDSSDVCQSMAKCYNQTDILNISNLFGRAGGRVVRAHAKYAADSGRFWLEVLCCMSHPPLSPICLLLNKGVYAG
uniref:Zinc finger RING-type eukaryotic domain-containing protein n=1 Tax=Sparus aurata TaxID=8175 RepID=A0A671Z2L5_SPAAU